MNAEKALPLAEAAQTPPQPETYVPRPLLTMAPAALGLVLIEPPMDTAPAGRHVGVLSLFIDEEGWVRQVLGEAPFLPSVMEQAARDAFLQARFTPGEIDGRAVKSRLRVEVVFDDAPL